MNEKFGCESCNINDNDGLLYVNECNDGVVGREFKIKALPQYQTIQPGMEYLMEPKPIFDNPNYKGSGKLKDKVAIITGGDSGIGRAVAVYFAKEGAKIVIVYYNEHIDAEYTKQYIESLGSECLLISGDLKKNSAQQTASECASVDCRAVECMYNDNCQCHAGRISVEGGNAHQSGGTECATFKCCSAR